MTPAAIVSKLWNFCNVLRDEDLPAALEPFRLIAEELGEEVK
jgi:hypothetical protein